jgi:hypothetical protein
MNEEYEVKGLVRRLRQRKQYRPVTPAIDRRRDRESFDVEFSPEGLPQEFTAYTYEGAFDGYERYFYDEQRRLIRALKHDNTEAEIGFVTYEYGLGGEHVEWKNHAPNGALLGSGVDKYRDGQLVSIETFRSNGLLVLQKEFEYAGRNLLKSVSLYYGIEGNLAERCICTFDSKGRLAETYGLKPDGEALGDGLYRYEYDAEGRKSRVLSFNDYSDSDIPNHISEFIYKSDQNGNWIERRELNAFESDDDWSERLTLRELTYYA